MKSATLVLFLLALVVSVVAPDVPAAPADDLVVDDTLAEDTNAIESLTPEHARRLAADFPGAEQEIIVRGSFPAIFREALPLNRLQVLDAATAKALAARKGRLALPNLKKISPKTLTALIKKEDVEIPRIETLEFIPEPDGSPTEDFIIPERFQRP
jgi:hypothetical protein